MSNFFSTNKLDITRYVPVDANFEIDKLYSVENKAIADVKTYISAAIFAKADAHLGSSDYEKDTNPLTVLDNLVKLIAPAVYNMAMYHNFVWLMIRASSNSLTTIKTEGEASLTKGQMIAARENLLEAAYSAINEIVDYLNENDALIVTAGETPTPIWSNTTQFTETKNLLFTGYNDFSQYYGIQSGAAFYFSVRHILLEVIDEMAASRIKLADLTKSDKTNAEKAQLTAAKKAVAYQTMANACRLLAIHLLPGSIRQNIDQEAYVSRVGELEIREKIAARLEQKAIQYWQKLDLLISPISENVDGYYTTESLETPFDATAKHATIL